MQRFTKEQFWAELEALGEDIVRERVVAKVYSSANRKLELAQEWLRVQDQSRSDAKEAIDRELTIENLEIAKSSKNAAWVAATCAAIAVVISLVALWFSIPKSG